MSRVRSPPFTPYRKRETIDFDKKVWESAPDLRLGQLILNAIPEGRVLYAMEDDELIELIEELYLNESG
ncbi:MAG: hypothetical protein ACTSRU_15900 [Candidatus Hodarchaeales archaeon]